MVRRGSGVQEDKNGNRYEGFFKQGKKTVRLWKQIKMESWCGKEPIKWEG